MEVPKYLIKDANNTITFDRPALQAAGVKDFKVEGTDAAAIIAFYDYVLEQTNLGNKEYRMTCEVSDFAIHAKCKLTL